MKFESLLSLAATAALAGGLMTACAPMKPAAPTGLLDVMDRAPERALLAGLNAYDNADYVEAEKQLQIALRSGLPSPRDRAAAHKTLAFIFCISQRTDACAAAFRAARVADPGFALTRAELGHPIWGPVYKQVISP